MKITVDFRIIEPPNEEQVQDWFYTLLDATTVAKISWDFDNLKALAAATAEECLLFVARHYDVDKDGNFIPRKVEEQIDKEVEASVRGWEETEMRERAWVESDATGFPGDKPTPQPTQQRRIFPPVKRKGKK